MIFGLVQELFSSLDNLDHYWNELLLERFRLSFLFMEERVVMEERVNI